MASDGSELVTSYNLEIYEIGSSLPYQVVSIGKPLPEADGKVRVSLAASLSSWPPPPLKNYEARIATVGATGSVESAWSNSFSFTVTCAYSTSSTSQTIASAGGPASVAVTAPNGCGWTVASDVPWIAAGAGGTGSGNASYTAANNVSSLARNGTLTVAGIPVAITQLGVPCTFSTSLTGQSFPAAGGNGSVTITAPAGCGWSATSDSAWITSAAGGTGSGNASYTVANNASSLARTGTLTVAGSPVTITQVGVPCTFTTSPTSQSFPAAGGVGTAAVTTPSGCTWTATSSVSWITPGAGGTGSGNAGYTVANNGSSQTRTGTLTVAGMPLTITQVGLPCTFTTISPNSQSFPAAGGTGSVAVTTPTGCTWTATSNVAWITPGGGGSGSGTAAYTVAPNTSSAARTGALTIAGTAVTIVQSGACSFQLSVTSLDFGWKGGNATVSLSTQSGCGWTATSNAAWLTVTTASGVGNATVKFTVAKNQDSADRSGVITIGGQSLVITQSKH